jgi:hypothetical protein
MTPMISDRIRSYLGWCPNVLPQVRTMPVQTAGSMNTPSQRGTFGAGAMDWFRCYRNQVLISTIALSTIGFWLFASFGGWSALYLFIIGMGVGLVNSAIIGIWSWRMFDTVLHEGPVELWHYQYSDTVRRAFTIFVSAVLVVIPVLGLLGVFPGIGLKEAIAFGGGFVAVSTWGTLISIWLWESGTHRTLQYNFEMLDLANEGTHADS